MHVSPIPKHLQRLSGLPVRRLQHQKHDTQVGFHVPRVEPIHLLHDPHTPRSRTVERLPVGVLAIPEMS